MAFEIGERVTGWYGPGTVVGPLERDEDGVAVQSVIFDNVMFGQRLRAINKLTPLYPEDEAKSETKAKVRVVRTKIQKAGGNDKEA